MLGMEHRTSCMIAKLGFFGGGGGGGSMVGWLVGLFAQADSIF